jgi:hypothetical protein
MADQDPMAAVQEGLNFVKSLQDQSRKSAAYNVLRKSYGDIAGDPEAALNMQAYGQRELTNPIAVQQAQSTLKSTDLSNVGKEQENVFNAGADPLKLRGLDLENTSRDLSNKQTSQNTQFEAQLQPGKVAQQGATLAQTRAQTGLTGAETAHTQAETAQAKLNLATVEGAQLRATAMGLLAGLSDTANKGGDIGAAFDKIAPQIAQFEGVTPDHLGPLRAKLVADPVGTINSLADAIHAANQESIKNTPAGVLAQQKYDDTKAAQVQALGVTAQRTQAVPGATEAARALVPQMSSSAILRKARAEIPGTPEYKYMQLVEQIKTNASLDDLRATRAGGLSLGRTTNTEFVAAGSALANLDLGQDPKMLVGNLQRLHSIYGVINGSLQADVKRLSTQRGPGTVHVTGPQGAAPADTNGKSYTYDPKTGTLQ